MSQKVLEVNIKQGMPSVETARERLIAAIESASQKGVRIVKIIHGYGSSGVGGKLRVALRKSLARRRAEGKVARIIYGESWSKSDDNTQQLLGEYPGLKGDRDLDKYNEGITIIELPEREGS